MFLFLGFQNSNSVDWTYYRPIVSPFAGLSFGNNSRATKKIDATSSSRWAKARGPTETHSWSNLGKSGAQRYPVRSCLGCPMSTTTPWLPHLMSRGFYMAPRACIYMTMHVHPHSHAHAILMLLMDPIKYEPSKNSHLTCRHPDRTPPIIAPPCFSMLFPLSDPFSFPRTQSPNSSYQNSVY